MGGQEVGISCFDEIIARGLERVNESDDVQRSAILEELKVHNYVAESVEKDYMESVWKEYRKARAKHLGQIEEDYHGIPREEIQWFPRVDSERCSGCGACVEFCQKKVYTLGDKAAVENPYRCVVSCTGCLKVCAEGAISFPSFLDLRESMKSLREKHGLGPV